MYVVINALTKTIISRHEDEQECWTAWQNIALKLTGINRDAIKHGKEDYMKKKYKVI